MSSIQAIKTVLRAQARLYFMSVGPVRATHPVTFQVAELFTQKWQLTLAEPRAAHCDKPSHK